MRRLLALLVLCVLVASAGCAALGPGSVDEEDLAADVDYDWNTSADATVELGKGEYRAIYHLSNQETVELSRPRRLNNREPIDPIGLDFRYPNGTVVNLTTAHVERSGGATVVTPPDPNGSIGFVAKRQGKNLRLPAVVNGSYQVILPPGGQVKYPLLGRVIPGGYSTSTLEDGRVSITWDNPDRNRIVVEYYLVRDLAILTGLVAIGAIAIVGGLGYFYLTIRRLRRRREEVALDVETGDSGNP